MDMASTVYYFKFENREECYEICRSVGYCFTDPVTGDTIMDVPGKGHIDVAGQFYDPDVQPLSASPEGEMEPDFENYVWKEGFHLNVVISDDASIPENLLPYQIEVTTPNLPSR
jgi:hypothetical protein